MNNETVELLKPIAESVALSLSRRFWATAQVEFGDVFQECWMWALNHPGKVAEYLKLEDGEGKIRTSMRNAALDFCQKEKAQRLGYETSDLYYWGKGDVEVSLGAMFEHEAWLSPPHSEGRTSKSAAEGGNYIASLADLSRAYDKLPAAEKALLSRYYHHDESQFEIADDLDVSQQTVSRRIDKALRRIADVLGGPAPRQGSIHDPDANGTCECGHQRWGGPGTRRAMTGAQARAITANTYDGDGS